jgi:hypothetical protein
MSTLSSRVAWRDESVSRFTAHREHAGYRFAGERRRPPGSPAGSVSWAKSSDQRSFIAMTTGARLPRPSRDATAEPLAKRRVRLSVDAARALDVHHPGLAPEHHIQPAIAEPSAQGGVR